MYAMSKVALRMPSPRLGACTHSEGRYCQAQYAAIEALAKATVRARLADLGQEIFPSDEQTPEALAAFHKAEIEKWWPILKATNIKGG
jgi:hypothetical protein